MLITSMNQADMKHHVYIHDSKIFKTDFDYNERSITFILDNVFLKKRFAFHCKGLVYLEWNALDLWGVYSKDTILEFAILKDDERNEKLHSLLSGDNNNAYMVQEWHQNRDQLMLCLFLADSGNRLLFICKTIDFQSSELVREKDTAFKDEATNT